MVTQALPYHRKENPGDLLGPIVENLIFVCTSNMKYSKAFILLIGFLVTITVPAFSQEALGVNYNQFLQSIQEQEVSQVNATWIRGFLDMHLLGNQDPSQNPNIQAILKAKAHGRRTILNLKWNYETGPFPTAGSGAMTQELDQLNRVLPVVMGKVDILVIGNEPFIETQSTQSGQPLIDFYETMANGVIGYWSSHAEAQQATQLYIGAFTRLDLVANRTPAVQWMLQYIASHQELSGPDLHMHMPNFAANQIMLSYVLPWLRPDQKFLVTEFSLVLLWYQHLSDPVSPDFTSRYNLPTPLEVYQFINLALQNPVPDAEWQDFLMSCPWYMSHRQFLLNAYNLFRGTGRLAVANDGMFQAWTKGQQFTSTTMPWLLNALFASATVKPRESGSWVENFPWAAEFTKLQTTR
jgi:hypothetical protein